MLSLKPGDGVITWPTLTSTSFMYERDLYPLKMYLEVQGELSRSRLSKVIVLQTDRQIDRQTEATSIYHAAWRMVNNEAY